MSCRISTQIGPSDCLITANQRLATALLKQWLDDQPNTIHPRPAIYTLNTWVKHHHMLLQPMSTILSHDQTIALWLDVLPEVNLKLAQSVHQAHELLLDYQVPEQDWRFYPTEEAKQLWQWATAFKARMQTLGATTEAGARHTVLLHFANHPKQLPYQRLILAGFDEYTPIVQTYVNAISDHCEIIQPTSQASCETVETFAAKDQNTQIRQMALWAKAQYDNHPNQHIACIIPDLHHLRDQIVSEFTRVFALSNTLPGGTQHRLPFNITAAKPLREYTLIEHGLSLLKLAQLDDLRALRFALISPFLPWSDDEQAELEAALNRTYETTLQPNLTNVLQHLSDDHPLHQRYQPTANTQLSLHEWLALFHKELNALQWLQGRDLSSEEYQATEKWATLWQQLPQTLYWQQHAITRQQALRQLTHASELTLFQPQNTGANIEIMGLLESSGFHYDKLWVMDMGEQNWPTKASLHPLIPASVQLKHNLPHSSPERELHFCEHITTRLQNAALELVVSFTALENECPQHCSSLWVLSKATDYMPLDTCNLSQPTKLERWHDEMGKPAQTVSLSATTLREQAQCPFRAYARLRLDANNSCPATLGVDALARGNHLHQALELFWQQIKTQAALQHLAPADKQQAIQSAIKHALRRSGLSCHYYALETKRLEKVLTHWLNLEANTRDTFEVTAVEQDGSLLVSQTTMRLRADRIDSLADHSLAIVDYKSGDGYEIRDWLDPDRLLEPQLPLYALTEPNRVKSIAYAILKPDRLRFNGIGERGDLIAGIKPLAKLKLEEHEDWQSLLKQWSVQIKDLVDEYQQGYAAVDPAKASTCAYCDLHSFCRIAAVPL